MVAWFTVVVEANCTRQPVSFLFPHSGIRRRGGNNKETTSLVVLASDTNISYATTATTLWLKQEIFFRVYSPNCHDIARISLRNEVICNCVHCRFNNLINKQHKQWIRFGFWVGKTLLLQVLLACNNVVNHEHQRHMLQHRSCSRDVTWLFMIMWRHMTSWSRDVTWLFMIMWCHMTSRSCDITWLFIMMWRHMTSWSCNVIWLHAHVMTRDSHSHTYSVFMWDACYNSMLKQTSL